MKTMNKNYESTPALYRKLMLAGIVVLLVGCSQDDDETFFGNWVERSVFDGVARNNAASFVIAENGYMGTGYDGDDYYNDFYSYNSDGDFWVQLADFPGVERTSAVAFDVDGKGYMGTGSDGDDELSDFYEYNPQTNLWNQIADFPTLRRSAVGFGGIAKGYVGTGFDGENDLKDFYSYNPSSNTWEQIVGFGGSKRRQATTFRIGDLVYIGTGVSNGLLQDDFYSFDLNTETFTRLLDIDEEDDYLVERFNGVGFALNGRGYIATGNTGGGLDPTVWEYNPQTDVWDEKENFEKTFREGATVFDFGSRAFVALGRNGGLYLDDNLEYFPNDELETED